MTKILVLYDKWIRDEAEEMWRKAFYEALGGRVDDYNFIYVENSEGPVTWSTDIVDNVKEAFGNPSQIKKVIAGCTVAVSGYAPFTREVLDASEKLKIVGISRGGPVNVDRKAVREGDHCPTRRG